MSQPRGLELGCLVLAGFAIIFVVALWNRKPAKILTPPDPCAISTWQAPGEFPCLSYMPDSKTIVTASYIFQTGWVLDVSAKPIKIWENDGASGKPAKVFSVAHAGSIPSVATSPDGTQLVSGGRDGKVVLWKFADGSVEHEFKGHSSFVSSVLFFHDGQKLASGSWDGDVRIWDITKPEGSVVFSADGIAVNAIALHPDGNLLAAGYNDGMVRWFDVSKDKAVHAITAHAKGIRSISYSPDGKLLASGSHDTTIGVWSTSTGTLVRRLKGHQSQVNALCFSSDSRVLASGSGAGLAPTDGAVRAGLARSDHSVRLWTVDDGKQIRVLQPFELGVFALAFSPNGEKLAAGSRDQTFVVWDYNCLLTSKSGANTGTDAPAANGSP